MGEGGVPVGKDKPLNSNIQRHMQLCSYRYTSNVLIVAYATCYMLGYKVCKPAWFSYLLANIMNLYRWNTLCQFKVVNLDAELWITSIPLFC